jgi:hypothetical protein
MLIRNLGRHKRHQLGCRYLRQQGSDGCWQSAVGKGNCSFANSIGRSYWQIRWTRLLPKKPSFANSVLCQQHGPKLLAKLGMCFRGSPSLPTARPKAVGKAGKAGEESLALPTALAHVVD